MAPIIDTIIEIFWDIMWFTVILTLNGFVFSSAFYILAQNQIMFDDLSEDDLLLINYDTFTSSIWFTYALFLGETARDGFKVGKAS